MYPQEEAEKRLIDAANHVRSLGYQPVYIALHGSQNYGLDTPQSDFDFQCIVLPTLDDLIHEKSVSTSIAYNGGLIEVKDLRQHVKSTIKMNPTYIETFLTPYAVQILPCPQIEQIKALIPNLLFERQLAFMEALRGIFARYYIMSGVLRWNDHEEDADYKPKAAYECARMYCMMRYFMSTGYFLMVPRVQRKMIYAIKTHQAPVPHVMTMLNTWNKYVLEMIMEARKNYPNPDNNTGNQIQRLAAEAIKQSIQTEVNNKKAGGNP